jgi:8-oxo-dGTP pyrophosphatase MutT (NUDIX family)
MSDIPRPGPGEELNIDGPPVEPRQAATVIVLRGGAERLELLLVQRNPEQRFMGGAWVFPGGAVDTGEGDGDAAHRLAAVREVEEEAGVRLSDPDSLVKFSRWITPAMVKIRFDTHFFLAEMPDDQDVAIDGRECVDFRWSTPQDALDAHRRGELLLVFPTIKHLEQLSCFPSADTLLEHTRGREVVPVEPKVLGAGEEARVVLPGEPGYEE